MSLLHFRNARIFAGGFELTADQNAVAVDLAVELLDNTTFGATTRTHKGGLTMATITGSGFWNTGPNRVEQALFGVVGVDGTIVTVFPNGITEGTATDMGFSFQGVVSKYDLKGTVAQLLSFDTQIEGRGIEVVS